MLLVSSTGGVLLDLLALEPWSRRHDVTWVAVRGADTESVLANARVKWASEQVAEHPLGLVGATFAAWRFLRTARPDIIVSAGSGVAVGYFVAAFLLQVPTIWVSTFNLERSAGSAARICSRLASAVVLQRASMLEAHPDGVVFGELY